MQNNGLCFVNTKESIKLFNLNPKHCVYNEYTEFYYTKTYHLKETPQHLSISCLLVRQGGWRSWEKNRYGPTVCETIIENGKILAAAQEERFIRLKHDSSYPFNAIEFELD